MKKIIVILGLIGFGFIATAEEPCYSSWWNPHYKCCDNMNLHSWKERKQYYRTCDKCHGSGTKSVTCPNSRVCPNCEGYKKQKCRGSNGTYDRWTHCNDCTVCRGDGLIDGLVTLGCTYCGGTDNCRSDNNRRGSGEVLDYKDCLIFECRSCGRRPY
ncbi:MAG: hypothetical protein LBN27_01365 [Prevotellaceae bacterium]|jgi:hypothetical protein|nr:hypothetical protein [Prevotellaceae bacterium]